MTLRDKRYFAKPIPEHEYHNLTAASLLYIIKDAGEAAQAMRGHDYAAECKYLDQVNDACTILRYRRMLAAQNHAVLEQIHKLNSGG